MAKETQAPQENAAGDTYFALRCFDFTTKRLQGGRRDAEVLNVALHVCDQVRDRAQNARRVARNPEVNIVRAGRGHDEDVLVDLGLKEGEATKASVHKTHRAHTDIFNTHSP